MKIEIREMEKNILVSVFMTAYNHAAYIRDAIEGVIKQRTTFKIELIIHDDASQDQTANIIREYEKKYPDIIVPIYQTENQFSKHISPFQKIMPKYASGKYIAICEGDDYWIDEYKLQKQVDFLENHPDYSMSMHNAWQYDMKLDKKVLLDTFPTSGEYSLEAQVRAGLGTKFPATASYIFLRKYFNEMPEELSSGFVLDYPLRVYMASRGKVYYFEEPMSVYRYSSEGSFTEGISRSMDYYKSYIELMGKLYRGLDKLLVYKFSDIYQKKIKSDYIGLATKGLAEAEEKGSPFDICDFNRFDQKLLLQCVNIIEKKNLDKDLQRFIENNDEVYLYGTSKFAEQIANKLDFHAKEYCGFIVSDGYAKPDEFCGKKTYYLSEIVNMKKAVGIILSIQPINEDGIISNFSGIEEIKYYRFFMN